MRPSLEPLPEDSGRALRRAAIGLTILASLGVTAGRMVSVVSDTGDAPFLSANDRSRWCTIRALADEGTYQIDNVIQLRHAKTKRRHWYTIDMVQHRGRDGRQHYYSSKPPLLPTLLAGQYWLIKKATGVTLGEKTFYVVRLMLLLTNLLPLVLYLLLLARVIERYGTTDWGRLFVATAAAWGTFVTTFAVSVNNHTPAAITALLAVCAALPIVSEGRRRWIYFAAAGLFAALTAANELPALALVALLGGVLAWQSPRLTLTGYAPAALLVLAAFLATSYAAHGSWRPPYAHRGDGPVIATFSQPPAGELVAGPLAEALRRRLQQAGVEASGQAQIRAGSNPQRWELWDPSSQRRLALVAVDPQWQVREWDNWYDYPGSYWTSGAKQGVDRGEDNALTYAFHVLLGHHGVFSLTPLWLFSVAGAVLALRRRGHPLRWLALLVALLTLVCLAFYLTRPLADRNYGGVSCSFRWLIWFTPLWLICLLPAADAIAPRRRWRLAALACLAISILSASYPLANPWTPPWLFEYWEFLGWIRY